MFLCAVARPRFNANESVVFDEKIGFWPFVELVPAQSSLKNRPKGTLELKPVGVRKKSTEMSLLTSFRLYEESGLCDGWELSTSNRTMLRRTSKSMIEMKNVEEIVKFARKAFDDLNPHALNNTFLSLQNHMHASMLVEGGNNYKEPHMSKGRRRKAGENIEIFTCTDET